MHPDVGRHIHGLSDNRNSFIDEFDKLIRAEFLCAHRSTGPAIDISEKVNLTIGARGLGNSADDPNWLSSFVKYMQDKLNIELSMVDYTEEKLNLILAGGDMPELLMVSNSKISQVLEGNLAIALDDYLEDYGANISKFTVRNKVLREYMSNGTGKLYFHVPNTFMGTIPDNYAYAGASSFQGNIVRWELYKELGCPEINNDEDYLNVLKQMQALPPPLKAVTRSTGSACTTTGGFGAGVFAPLAIAVSHDHLMGICASDFRQNIVNNYLDYSTPVPYGTTWSFIGD